VLVTCEPNRLDAIEDFADRYGYYAVRIGTTGGDRLEISVYKQSMISSPISSLREPWAFALEANIHGEVAAR
jgi:hypothetical protein